MKLTPEATQSNESLVLTVKVEDAGRIGTLTLRLPMRLAGFGNLATKWDFNCLSWDPTTFGIEDHFPTLEGFERSSVLISFSGFQAAQSSSDLPSSTTSAKRSKT